VRLGASAGIMGLAEGVETALSAMQLTGMTVWASLGSSRLHSVELPPEVEEVHIFVDNDEPGRGAARRAAGIHTRLRREVYLRSPPDQCGDWNDFLNLIANRDGRDLSTSATTEDAA
jgi:putative DNA primase/helicase